MIVTVISILLVRKFNPKIPGNNAQVMNEDRELKNIDKSMAEDLPEIDESLEVTATTGSTEPSGNIDIDTDLNDLDSQLNDLNLPDIEADL